MNNLNFKGFYKIAVFMAIVLIFNSSCTQVEPEPPANTIALSSTASTNAQTNFISTAITPITYTTTGATGATFSGLPEGVTGAWLGNVVTISGTPTVSGIFNYTVSLTGGSESENATGPITGTITVTPIIEPVTSNYVGTWVAIEPISTDYGDILMKGTITFSDRSLSQIGQIQILTNSWIDYVSMKGSISVNGNLMTVTLTDYGLSSTNQLGIPTGEISSYKTGTTEFDKLLSDMQQTKIFSSEYSVSGNQLTLKTDLNGDGDYLDDNEITVYTKQ